MRDLLQKIVPACLVVCVLATLMPGCGGTPSSPSAPTSSLPAGTITGRETIGWDQQAPDSAELGLYSYVLYVDGLPFVLASVTCGALTGDIPSAPCSSPLPSLQSGRHTLELATRITYGDTVLESPRSTPLVVTVATAAPAGSA